MGIGIVGSIQFTEKMLEFRDELIKMDDAFISSFYKTLIGKIAFGSPKDKYNIK